MSQQDGPEAKPAQPRDGSDMLTMPILRAMPLPAKFEQLSFLGNKTVDLSQELADAIPGTFKETNGVVAILDEKGRFFVAPKTPSLMEALKEMNFEPGELPVPFKNSSDIPAESYRLAHWQLLKADAERENRRERHERVAGLYMKIAEERDIIPGVKKKVEALNIDGMEVRKSGATMSVVYGDVYGDFAPKDRQEQVGTYAYKDGLVAFVDETGRLYCAKNTTPTLELLKSHGYQKSDMPVPLTDSERPVLGKDRRNLMMILESD